MHTFLNHVSLGCYHSRLDPLTFCPAIQHNTLDGPMPLSGIVINQPLRAPTGTSAGGPRIQDHIGGRTLSAVPTKNPAAPRSGQGMDAVADAAAASVAAAVAAVADADAAPAAPTCGPASRPQAATPRGAIVVDSASAPAAARLRPEVQVVRRSVYDTEVPSREELDQMTFIQKVQSVYHRPISEAAQVLDMGVTVLKKQCREQGIARWPFRKLQSIDKLIQSVQSVRHQLTGMDMLCLVTVCPGGHAPTIQGTRLIVMESCYTVDPFSIFCMSQCVGSCACI